MRNQDQKTVCSRGSGAVVLTLETFKPGMPSCCSFFALAHVCALHLRRPPTPNNVIVAMLQRTHFKVPCAAECLMLPACDGLSKAWATLSALTLPPPLLLPLVLPLPPQASQKLTSRNPLHKCSSLSLKSFLLPPSPPNPLSRISIPPSPSRQIAVMLLDGRRERLTLNQSFTGEPKLCDPFSSQRCCRTVCLLRDTASLCPAVGHLYARVSEFTPPGISFTLSGGFPPTLLTDHSATLASAALLNVLVRQAKS